MRSFDIRWAEPLGLPECPYVYRWALITPLFSIRVHHFLRSDDKRYYHDHPWGFVTIVLKGKYSDISRKGTDPLKAGSIRYRPPGHEHYVIVPKCGAWTLLFTGPPVNKWGFKVNGKKLRPVKYFNMYGHPPCKER